MGTIGGVMGKIGKRRLIRLALGIMLILYFHFYFHMPPSLLLIMAMLVALRFLPVRQAFESRIDARFPAFRGITGWKRTVIFYGIYLAIYAVLKLLIINVIMEWILGIPVGDELQAFVDRYSPGVQ